MERQGNPKLRLSVGELETPRHDADDRISLIVEPQCSSYHLSVRTKATLPGPVAQQDDPVLTGSLFLGLEDSAHDRSDSQQRKKRGRDLCPRYSQRFIEARHIEAGRRVGCNLLENGVVLPPLPKVIQCEASPSPISHPGTGLPDLDDRLGIVIGQWAQQDSMYYTEDGTRGSDAECKGK